MTDKSNESIKTQEYYNAISIEIINENLSNIKEYIENNFLKINKDFKAITNKFDTNDKQNRIFYEKLKSNTNIVKTIENEKIKTCDFKERINDIIINLQSRIESLEDKFDKKSSYKNENHKDKNHKDDIKKHNEIFLSNIKNENNILKKNYLDTINELKKENQILKENNNKILSSFKSDTENLKIYYNNLIDDIKKNLIQDINSIKKENKELKINNSKILNEMSSKYDMLKKENDSIKLNTNNTDNTNEINLLKQRINNNEIMLINQMNIIFQMNQGYYL